MAWVPSSATSSLPGPAQVNPYEPGGREGAAARAAGLAAAPARRGARGGGAGGCGAWGGGGEAVGPWRLVGGADDLEVRVDEDGVWPVDADVVDLVVAV